ncbi:hypothetical protein HDR67_02150 [bacterium]|nr:hypothetical protein [bacterium]
MNRFLKKGCTKIVKGTIFIAFCMMCISISGCKSTKHQHKTEHVEKVEASCIKEGQKEHWKCLGCDQIFSDAEGKHEITFQDIILTKTEHQIVEDASLIPTCGKEGMTAGIHCSYCNLVIQEQEIIPKLEHPYDIENATWIWNGFEEAIFRLFCKNDANHMKEYVAEIKSETRDPTCLNPGERVYTASICLDDTTYADSKTEVLLPTEHEFDVDHILWNWEGNSKVVAQIPCKYDSSHDLNVLAEINQESVGATCTEVGKKITTASIVIDGKSYSDSKEEEIAAIGHAYDYQNVEWEWEDYSRAKAIVKCIHNPSHQLEFDADITSTTTPPTCTIDGVSIHTAKVILDSVSYEDEKEETLSATGHDYDYHLPLCIWNGYDSAKVQLTCQNNSSHLEEYDAYIEKNTTYGTCAREGRISYVAHVKVDEFHYTYEKSTSLPIDETNHEYDYEDIHWEWIPVIEGYHAKATIQCKCGLETQTQEELAESITFPSTFEETGNIQYEATAFHQYRSYIEINLPIKKMVSTEEEFLEAIQSESYDLTLSQDIVLKEGANLKGTYAKINLNGYSLSMPNYSLWITATHAVIQNGFLIVDEDDTKTNYAIVTNNRANILIEDVTTFGGMHIYNANAIIRNCDVTTLYYAVCAQEKANVTIEGGVYRKNSINEANSFFWIVREGKEDGLPYSSSKILLKDEIKFYTTSSAILYNLEGVEPAYEMESTIDKINPKEYLALDLEIKGLSLQKDLIYSLEDNLPNLSGRKVFLDLEGYTITLPEGVLHFSASLVHIRNGYITLDSDESEFVLTIEEASAALLENLVITGGIEVKNSNVILMNITLNATNSYAVSASGQAEVSLISNEEMNFLFQPKLKSTVVTKTIAGIHNSYYFVEEGSVIYLDSVTHETTTESDFYDIEGIPPIEVPPIVDG